MERVDDQDDRIPEGNDPEENDRIPEEPEGNNRVPEETDRIPEENDGIPALRKRRGRLAVIGITLFLIVLAVIVVIQSSGHDSQNTENPPYTPPTPVLSPITDPISGVTYGIEVTSPMKLATYNMQIGGADAGPGTQYWSFNVEVHNLSHDLAVPWRTTLEGGLQGAQTSPDSACDLGAPSETVATSCFLPMVPLNGIGVYPGGRYFNPLTEGTDIPADEQVDVTFQTAKPIPDTVKPSGVPVWLSFQLDDPADAPPTASVQLKLPS